MIGLPGWPPPDGRQSRSLPIDRRQSTILRVCPERKAEQRLGSGALRVRVSGASTSYLSAGAEVRPGAWLSGMPPDTSSPDKPHANDGPVWMSQAQSSL